MRVVTPQVMDRVFAVTDPLIHREALVVPLAMEGDGMVRRLPDGRWEIVLPDRDELDDFLDSIPGRLGD